MEEQLKEIIRSAIEQMRYLGKEIDDNDNKLINDFQRYDGACFYLNQAAEKLGIKERL